MQMSYTSDSITWNFTLPEDKDFQFEELDHVGLLITDVAKDPESSDYYTYYLDGVEENPRSGTSAFEFENVNIQVQNGKNYTITLKDLDIQDSYVTNLSSSSINDGEYRWEVWMFTDEDRSSGYAVRTAVWAFEPGKNFRKTIDEMQTDVWTIDEEHHSSVVRNVSVDMTHTKDSITWQFTMPDSVDFRLEDVKIVETSVYDVTNKEKPNIDKTYMLA